MQLCEGKFIESTPFICLCKLFAQITDEESNGGSLFVGHWVLLGKIDKFCLLPRWCGGCRWRMRLSSNGKSYSCIKMVPWILIHINWKRTYMSCVIQGSETWPMKKKHDVKADRTEVSMLRQMCGWNKGKEMQRSENGTCQVDYQER